MKVTVSDLDRLFQTTPEHYKTPVLQVLTDLARENKQFPAILSFQIQRLARIAGEEYQTYMKTRRELHAQFGGTEEVKFVVPPENMAEFIPELKKLLKQEVEIDCDVLDIPANLPGPTPEDFHFLGPFCTMIGKLNQENTDANRESTP